MMIWEGMKTVVMGLGQFGGGVGVTRWLLKHGAHVVVTDMLSAKELEDSINQVGEHPNLKFALNGHDAVDFSNIDLLVANPAIPNPSQNKFLKLAWSHDVQVTTEICLLVDRIERLNTIGITGSTGKSTTASMIHAAFSFTDTTAWLGGNIGGSLLEELDQIEKDDVVILELSSAMLWWLNRHSGGWSPHVAIITNISPNHIDWHGSFEAYEECKSFIFKNQQKEDIAFTKPRLSPFAKLNVLGKHNELNASFALDAAMQFDVEESDAIKGISSFSGLPHRLQRISNAIYNDSKSTTPIATELAVSSFDNPSAIHLIVGGYDKNIDLTPLAKLSECVGCLYTIGDTGTSIASLAKGNVKECKTLDRAVAMALEGMGTDDILLLSPGCASWDQFQNYENRGHRFIELVGK